MGSYYCYCIDKNTMKNEQTNNIPVIEGNIIEKKDSKTKKLDKVIKNFTRSDISGTSILNNKQNNSSFILTSNVQNNSNQNLSKTKSNDELEPSPNFNKSLVTLNVDVIVSGNEFNPEKIYTKKKLLGSGSFGEVWLVQHKNLNRNFAMKIIKKRKNNIHDEKEIKNEIEILKKLDHPKIVKIVEFYTTLKKYYIITEYCHEGELFNEIIKVGKFNEGEASFILHQILKAVTYCHKMNIIHRDIKPENIMIANREKNGCLQVKLIDFGTAKIFEKGQNEKKYVGSLYYMAPEVIKRQYNEKCDLWSIGVILYILLIGRPPFDGNDDEDIINNITKGEYDKKIYPYPLLSDDVKDLIEKLLQYDPDKRISAQEALKHNWFNSAEFIKKDKINSINPMLAKQLIKNMTKYRGDNALKCAVIAYLVHHLINTEECMEASKLFIKIDLNSDGKIEKQELIHGFEKYWGISKRVAEEKVELIFTNIDTDLNGFIEYEEFVRAAVDPSIFMSQNYLKFAFNYFDKNSSGDITFEEMKKRFTQNSKNINPKVCEELKEAFDSIDINGNGSICFSEFCKMMKSIIQSK